LLGNAALVVLKGVATVVTGSTAMLAETCHSLADTGNQLLLMLGMRLSRRPPDELHPFGHGRAVYFWAFVVAMMLFSVGGAFSLWEAIDKLRHPTTHRSFVMGYAVLGGAFVFEAISLTVALRALRRVMRTGSVWSYFRQTRDPTLATVVLEDTAAMTSIVVAGGGLALTQATGVSAWDAVASGVIGLVLIGVAVFLAFENYSLLIGESASPEVEARLRAVIEADPAVAKLVGLHTVHLGPESIVVVVESAFRDGDNDAIADAVRRLEARIVETLDGRTSPHLIIVEPRRRGEGRIETAAHVAA
jgi:cation diffusion facilitator family transporter